MKTIYITENQRDELEKSTSKTGRWSMMLNEETGTDRKKVMKIIADNCNGTYCRPYLMTPLSDVPGWLHDMCNPEGQEQGAWVSVKNNQHGMNRFIDFLVLNLKGQVGISHGNGPDKYIVGIARILCQDLGFYSFGENMNGGGIIKFSKLMKMIDKMPEFMLDGEELDKDLNGMSYGEIMQKFAVKMEAYVNGAKERLRQYNGGDNHHYRVVPINDTVNHQGMVTPDANGRNILDMLDRYTDWCVCGQNGLWEYSQYLSNGGKLYILMRDGFENVPREQGENCPLDEYGLSLIALIVGADGLPDNVTTRWNHEFGGENHNNMWNAEQIQELTGINYLQTFKPRNRQQLMQMHLAESKIPSAQDQVHNKVNAGIMDAVTGGGMMEENQGNLETWYRGYKAKYGSDYDHLLWLTDDIDYARSYGNRVEEVVLDRDKLNSICVSDLFDDGIDYLDGPSKGACRKLKAEGYNCYYFEANDDSSYCICLWDKSAIVSRRELSKEEFDKIEGYEGYDNPGYDTELDEMSCDGLLNENSNDRKVNKYIKEKFGLTDFQDIRNKVMEIYEAIPYARVDGGKFMLGVMRILFEEGLPRDEYSVLNKILYKIANSNYYERQGINDPNLGGKTFEELKEKYFVPDFEGTEFSTSEKMVRLKDGFTVTRIDSYDEMNARCDGEWCISYDDSLWYELVADGTVYLVENEELINKHDEAMENQEYANQFGELCDIAGEEDAMDEMGLINNDWTWVNKPGSWKFPYDYYGLSRFVVIVYKSSFVVYSRYNMPNEFDGYYLTKDQLENLLGIKFEDVFKFIPGKDGSWEYDEFGRKVPFGSVQHEMDEGAEPEADEYKIGGEGGNNEYFHAVNESIEMHSADDYTPMMRSIAEFMKNDGLNVYPYPKIRLNWDEQDGLFIKTGYYEPESKTIVIFCKDRHPKDILRTYAHEMIHHSQNLDGVDLNFSSEDDVKDNERLEEIESEAYLKGNVYFRKWTEYAKKDSKDVLQEGKYSKWLIQLMQRRDPDGIENLSEATDPDDIDLSSFNIKTQLNPKFWKDGRLDSRIRMKLLDIADDFIEFLGVDWVKPDDIIMTGSLANYNWNKKFSDIDLHILMDYSKVDKRTDFVDNYFYSQKKLWNDEHKDLKIFGFPVELYVQDTKEKHASTGVYSLDKDKWIREPERDKLSKSKINKSLIKNKVAEYIDKIDKLLTIYKGADSDYKIRKVSEDADKLFDEIKKERKSSLNDKEIEITNGNLIFKCLRRLGYIEKITTLMSDAYDKLNSLS